jgi:bifunctional non-homologous end joining protein LigD
LVEEAPTTDKWVHEIKFDGYRLQARIDAGDVQLLTRSGLDWTHRFGGLARALRDLKLGSAIIDGEAVVLDDAGVSSFVNLVAALKAGRSTHMAFFAFDLLYFQGANVMGATLLDRKSLLRTALKGTAKAGPIRYSEHFAIDGTEMLEEACKHGLEGIISKRRDKPYCSGRKDDWLKAKCIKTDEFVVAGYLDSAAAARSVGALVLGFYERGCLKYAGRVGTGFSRQSASAIWKQFQPLRVENSPVARSLTSAQRRDVTWVKPELVAQVEYRAWTGDGLLPCIVQEAQGR